MVALNALAAATTPATLRALLHQLIDADAAAPGIHGAVHPPAPDRETPPGLEGADGEGARTVSVAAKTSTPHGSELPSNPPARRATRRLPMPPDPSAQLRRRRMGPQAALSPAAWKALKQQVRAMMAQRVRQCGVGQRDRRGSRHPAVRAGRGPLPAGRSPASCWPSSSAAPLRPLPPPLRRSIACRTGGHHTAPHAVGIVTARGPLPMRASRGRCGCWAGRASSPPTAAAVALRPRMRPCSPSSRSGPIQERSPRRDALAAVGDGASRPTPPAPAPCPAGARDRAWRWSWRRR